MNKALLAFQTLCFIILLSVPALCLALPATAIRFVQQDQNITEAEAYRNWYSANSAGEMKKAFDLASAFLATFPTGEHADYFRKWIPQAGIKLLEEAVTAKDVAEIDRLGKHLLAADPDNLDLAAFLAVQLRTLDTNFQYWAHTQEFAQTSIRLIESGRTLTTNPSIPFNKNETFAYFYDTLAAIDEHNKDMDRALENFERAAQIDPENARYWLNSGRLHQFRYITAATEFAAFPETDRNAAELKPNVKAVLDRAQKEADAVITYWVRFMQLPKNEYSAEIKQKIMTTLTELYSFRHPDAPEGLKQLIPNAPVQ